MKRIWMVGAAVGVLAACREAPLDPAAGDPASANLGVASAVSGSVTGSAHVSIDFGVPLPAGLGLRNLGFNAIRHGDGTVTGQWQIVVGSSIIHGTIDCLVIAPGAQSARMSGVVTSSLFTSFQVGTAFAMEVFDNGNGGSGTPDVASEIRAFRNAAPAVGRAFCEAGTVPPGADLAPAPMDHGNVTIREL